MKLFWCPDTRAMRALWMLEEAGVAYQRVHVDIRDPAAPRDPGFAAASPLGKVPALEDGDARMADSAAICLYVADRYPERRLAPPADDPRRGEYLFWMLYTPAVIEPAIGEKFQGVAPNRISSGWGDFETMIDALRRRLAGRRWVLGDEFSAADVMVGSSVAFMRHFDLLPDSAALQEYLGRCVERPAYQTALAAEG